MSTGQSQRGGDGAALAEWEHRGFVDLPSIPSQGKAAEAGIKNLHLSLFLCLSVWTHLSPLCHFQEIGAMCVAGP